MKTYKIKFKNGEETFIEAEGLFNRLLVNSDEILYIKDMEYDAPSGIELETIAMSGETGEN